MPDLATFRTNSTTARPVASPTGRPPAPARPAPAWGLRLATWLRSTADALAPRGARDPAIDQLAEIAALAREPDEVRVALVRLASTISGGARAEWIRDRPGRPAQRMAVWPTHAATEAAEQAGSAPRGPIASAVARARGAGPTPPTLSIPLKAGGVHLGTLRMTSAGRRAWSAGAARRLGTLCAIAASAERGLATPRRGEAEVGLQGSNLLGACLTFAHAQARRRREPLSLLEVAVDRLASLRELLGDELAEVAIDRVDRAIRATIRASDVLGRLEDGRIAVILPNASAEDSMRVAEAIRAAIARAGAASTTMPALTASIGVANFPEHAQDLASLRASAADALTRAESQGNSQIASALPEPGGVAYAHPHRAE